MQGPRLGTTSAMEQGTAASTALVGTAPIAPRPVSAGRVGWLLGLLSGLGISGTSGLAVVLHTAAADLAMSPTTAAMTRRRARHVWPWLCREVSPNCHRHRRTSPHSAG